MKRVSVACVGILSLAALANPAAAADLSRRPVYKAPPPVAATVYNWTGFYIGINGGGAFGHSRWDSADSFNLSGGLAGGTIGYNWQMGSPWVFGLEGDLDWSNIDGRTTAFCPAGCKTRNDWLSTVRGRVGYAMDRIMPYVTGGLALGNIKATTPGSPGMTETEAGFTVGGGLEVAIAGNWTAKAEYLFVDLGKMNCGFNCGGVSPTDNVTFTSNVVRGGLNYRF